MPPQSTTVVETATLPNAEETKETNTKPQEYKMQIMWHNVVLLFTLHLCFIFAFYYGVTQARLISWVFTLSYSLLAAWGTTAGAHRLWCHRSYKANLPLRIILAILHCINGQTDLYEWCRDHRVHHKFTETDADPHNIKRGFFFAHCGWLMCKKHPEVIRKGKTISMDDLLADPVVRIQRKFHIPLVALFCFVIPTLLLHYCFHEPLVISFVCTLGRYVLQLNVTWMVNSAAHMYGTRPFDKSIEASDNAYVSFLAQGEGWHNYHHVFPWDYSTSELGYRLNSTKSFIDFMAWLGWAYDLKTASPEVIKNYKLSRGDGTRLEEYDDDGNELKKDS